MVAKISKAQRTFLVSLELVCGVIFGTPSRNCTGSGICMVTSLQILRKNRYACSYVRAWLGRGMGGELMIRFPFEAVSDPSHRQLLSCKLFEVDETFRIPPWLTSAWGKSSIFIPPGRYAIRKTDDSWIIIFPVNQFTQPSSIPVIR